MILYEVTLQVEPGLAKTVEEHMRRKHIPAIFATGCFQQIRFDLASAARFRTCYQARSRADLEHYLQEHAPGLRTEFQIEFPSGVTLTREIWIPQETWS